MKLVVIALQPWGHVLGRKSLPSKELEKTVTCHNGIKVQIVPIATIFIVFCSILGMESVWFGRFSKRWPIKTEILSLWSSQPKLTKVIGNQLVSIGFQFRWVSAVSLSHLFLRKQTKKKTKKLIQRIETKNKLEI